MPRQPSCRIRALVFDAYGTLVEITDKRHPYKGLLDQLPAASPHRHSFAQTVMSEPLGLQAAAIRLGMTLSPQKLQQLRRDLDRELASIRPFDDVLDSLATLRLQGLKFGICSNLAKPYAAPVQQLIPMAWDAVSWSFAVGAIKPQDEIYASVCRQLDIPPAEVLMIGDSENEDYLGPLRFGMQAIRLRRGQSPLDPYAINSLAELRAFIGRRV